MERTIFYIDVFLLTLAIGINSHTAFISFATPPPERIICRTNFLPFTYV